MLDQIRAQLRLVHEVLESATQAVSIVARRDLGVLHDGILKLETEGAVLGVSALHSLRKLINEQTPKEVKDQVEAAIAAVDAIRAKQGLPPSKEEAPAPAPVEDAPKPRKARKVAPVVPFEPVKTAPDVPNARPPAA